MLFADVRHGLCAERKIVRQKLIMLSGVRNKIFVRWRFGSELGIHFSKKILEKLIVRDLLAPAFPFCVKVVRKILITQNGIFWTIFQLWLDSSALELVYLATWKNASVCVCFAKP